MFSCMKGLAVFLCLIAVAPAAARDVLPSGVLAPPQYWEYQPLKAPVLLRDVPPAEVERLCPNFGSGTPFNACAVLEHHTCYVFIRNDGIHEDFYADLVRHEMAHCRGWPADHPN